MLRVEDIDRERCRPEFVDDILRDLAWLGLSWDGVVVQTERRAAHDAALARLRDLGLTYACSCTRAEIAASVSAPHGLPAAYPGTCRNARRSREGHHAERLDVAQAMAAVGDRVVRPDDVVLARKGMGVAYHLAVVCR